MLTPSERPDIAGGAKAATFKLRGWLAPSPWLRNLARWLYWDILGQNEHILVVASRCS
jgi:hypothetical protein